MIFVNLNIFWEEFSCSITFICLCFLWSSSLYRTKSFTRSFTWKFLFHISVVFSLLPNSKFCEIWHLGEGRCVYGSQLLRGGFDSSQHGLEAPSLGVWPQLLADSSVHLKYWDWSECFCILIHSHANLSRVFLHKCGLPCNVCQVSGCYKACFHILQEIKDSIPVKSVVISGCIT